MHDKEYVDVVSEYCLDYRGHQTSHRSIVFQEDGRRRQGQDVSILSGSWDPVRAAKAGDTPDCGGIRGCQQIADYIVLLLVNMCCKFMFMNTSLKTQ